MSWYSLHIHYHDPQDGLLVDCVSPLIASCRKRGLARWFFLRYWKHGPHVRLRLLLDDASAEATLREARAQITGYLARAPSTTVLSAERLAQTHHRLAELQGEDGGEYELLPNNTVRPQPYESELGKYGGEPGVQLAELLFERSSEVALEVLGDIRRAALSRLGISFAMVLAGLRSAGLSEAAMADFLAAYCRYWSRYASQELIATWPAGLVAQQRSLSAHAAAVLSGRSPADSRAGEALMRWATAVRTNMEDLQARASEALSAVTRLGPDATLHQRRDFVLFNHLHTHNNRLGVMPAQESYIAYLGHHVICGLAGVEPQEVGPGAPVQAVGVSVA